MRFRVFFGASPPAMASYFIASDADVGLWTPSAGGSVASCIDEPIPDDGDYGRSDINPSASAYVGQFESVATPKNANSHTLSYRIRADGTLAVQVELLSGSLSKTWTHSPAPNVWTQFNQSLTPVEAALMDYSSIQFSITAGV